MICISLTGPRYFVATAPCGRSWTGMTDTDDLQILVRRALKHAASCEWCSTAPEREQA